MKRRLFRFEYLLFLVSVAMIIVPLVVGPKIWLRDEFGFPAKFPRLSACIYYLALVSLAGVSGYRSLVGFQRDRRLARRAFVRQLFQINSAESLSQRIGLRGGAGSNIVEVRIEQPRDALDVQLDLTLSLDGTGRARKGRVLVDPSDDERRWETIVRMGHEWSAWLDVSFTQKPVSTTELTLSVTCFYSENASIMSADGQDGR